MTGNQDRAERAQARLDAVYERLDPMIDKAIDALAAVEPKAGDALAVQRYVRKDAGGTDLGPGPWRCRRANRGRNEPS